jgi:hypothetical protein
MNPPFIGVHPIVIDWSVALVIGLLACALVALIQEGVQLWRRSLRGPLP